MTDQIAAIDEEISALKKKLNQVEGKETEVYARIVGYYRSVRNWNVGKKGEYRERVPFSKLDGNPGVTTASSEEPLPDAEVLSPDQGQYWSYSYFYRTTCPNCPPMKEALNNLSMKSQSFNVDTEKGMEEAAALHIFSAPTVVFFDQKGKELYRTGNPKDIDNSFISSAATA